LVYKTEKHFVFNDKTQEINYKKLKIAFEGSYYFDNEKIIAIKIKGKNNEEEKNDAAIKNFLKNSKTYIKILSEVKY
jgi:hypothetical protein